MEAVTSIAVPASTVHRPLRVLIVVDGYYPSTGGAEMQARLIARSLAAAGHSVQVIAPRLRPTDPVRDVLDGVPLERIAYPRVRVLGGVLLALRFGWRLLWRRGTYDAIHVHTAENLAAMAGLLRPLLSATVTVKISGASEFNGGVLDPLRASDPLVRVRNAGIRRVDHLQCISAYTHTRLLDAGYARQRLLMIPNAVDVERFSPGTDAVRPIRTVAFVGRLVPVKALPVLLTAWRRVAEQSQARLVLGGDGPLRHQLEAQAATLGISHCVEFRGAVQDVPALLREADAYVQPSYQEGLPNAVLEAMACGLPVVATRISGNEDVVTDGVSGLLVPAGDADALAAALLTLIAEPARAREIARRGLAQVRERYSVPAVLSQLVQAYRSTDGAHA